MDYGQPMGGTRGGVGRAAQGGAVCGARAAAAAQLHRGVPGYGVEQCSGQVRVLNQTSTATLEEIKRSEHCSLRSES